ncbi:MAG: glycosyltransferase family 4 protein [Bacteroidetes bacterium]|nr:glycosyltransferase family 4 protein [Bacteroidota bacterium]
MKILFLGDTYHPNAIAWIRGMQKFGDCIITEYPALEKGLDQPKYKRIYRWFVAIFKVRKLVKKEQFDLVLGYRLTSYGVLAVLSGHQCVIITAQGGTADAWPLNQFLTPIKKLLARFAISRADLVHAWGLSMSKSIIQLGCKPEKLFIKPRGIDLDFFIYPENQKFSNDKLNIVCTRSLRLLYNHRLIIEALKKVRDKGIVFSFTIVGDGLERKSLEEFVIQNDLQNNVHFVGRIGNDYIVNYLRNADIYISLPISEGVSASLLEAMACGCYPIVSDLPSNRDWINGNGKLVSLDNSEEIMEAILDTYYNKNNINNILLRNRRMVEDVASQEKNIKLIIDKYKEITKTKSEKSK